MRTIIVLALLAGVAAPAFSCDFSLGPGKVLRGSEGAVGGFITAACLFNDKWEVRGFWFGDQPIYGGTVTVKSFPALSVSRLWTFREGKRFQPVLGFGLLLKEPQRCKFDGDIACNRLVPLPVSFYPTAGIKLWGTVLLTLGHASNDGLDWGPEKKNLGLDSLRLEAYF